MTTKKAPSAPLRVRIGHRFYAVRYVETIEHEGVPCDGLCVYDCAEVLLFQGLPPDAMAEKFLHEVLHALHWELGLSDDSDEEAFTNLVAKGLCRFHQDNPGATRWLLHSLKPPKD
jgi:hypothetical protein